MAVTEYIAPRSPGRIVEEIDAKLAALRGSGGDINDAQIRQLVESRSRWAAEVEELREAHGAHALHMSRLHARLAQEHWRRWKALAEGAANG